MAKSGFSLRGQTKKNRARKRPLLPVLQGPFAVPAPPRSNDPASQFEYLRDLTTALGHIDEPRCQEIRAGILDVVQKLAAAVDALQRKQPSAKQIEALAKRAERSVQSLVPDIFEANYFMANRYLSRHRHAHPPGSAHALSDTLEQAIREYACAASALGKAMRSAGDVSDAQSTFDAASEAVRQALLSTPAHPLDD